MTLEFASEYIDRCFVQPTNQSKQLTRGTTETKCRNSAPLLTLLAAANPNKMLCVKELVHRHSQDNGKILVFCDHIMLLKEYAQFLGCPFVCGETAHKDRLKLFSDFQATNKLNVVCISRVGDVSVNLPAANVVIQVSSHGGSRRQEAQRLGRILRPKERSCDGRRTEAYFYSIVSSDSYETVYASRRTQFLLDLGYSSRCATFVPSESHVDGGGVDSGGTPTAVIVGDVAQVKREMLFGSYGGMVALRPTTSSNGPGQQLQAHPLCSLDERERKMWCLSLLAKVVAQWELQFAQELRDIATRRRQRQQDDDDAVEKEQESRGISRRRIEGGRRSAQEIKEELAPHQAAPCAGQWLDGGALADLTTLAVDLVYHEF